MTPVMIRLFGQLDVCWGSGKLPRRIQPRKARELLAYLLLNRGRTHSREALAALFWGDSRTADSMKYLRQALWRLRAVFEPPEVNGTDSIFLIEADSIALNPAADLWLDVSEFERTCDEVLTKPGGAVDSGSVASLQAAARLYRGDLLEGWYQDWCVYERERLKRRYIDLMEVLIAIHEVRGEYEKAISVGEEALRHDPAHENIHRCLIRLYAVKGDRTDALRQYERCVSMLREELNAAPSTETAALYEQIRSNPFHLSGRAVPATAQGMTPEVTQAVAELLSELKRLKFALGEAERSIHKTIRVIEATFGGQE